MSMRFLICVLVAGVAACGTPTGACGCSPVPPPSAIAYGILSEVDGTPIVGGLVNVSGKRSGCPGTGEARAVASASQPSDASGRYRVQMAYFSTDTMCAQLSARRSLAISADTMLSTPFNVVRRSDGNDSVRVDISFP